MKKQTSMTIVTHLLRAAFLLLLLGFAIYVMPGVLGQRVGKKAVKAQPNRPEGTTIFRLDHFKAYRINPQPPPLNAQVMLKDQFDSAPQPRTVLDPVRFANPVQKDRAGKITPITNPESHLKLYNLNPGPIVPPRPVIVNNQFGPQALNVQSSRLLAVPTQKNNGGIFHDLDHFKCYDCTGNPVNVSVNLTDQFHVENNVVVLQPIFLCNPTFKFFNNATTPILRPNDHLVFYAINNQPPFNIVVNTNNQFGLEPNLPLQQADLLGVPSAKLHLDHFKAYRINPQPPPLNVQVGLRDQFDAAQETRTVLNPIRFANPVQKDRGGIITPINNPNSHLKLYNLNPVAAPRPRIAAVYNQFGPQKLNVQSSRLLAVPTQKNNVGNFQDLDHFKCYDCTGDPVNVSVNLTDQFHVENNVVVLQPRFLCNPVVKVFNGTTPILHPDDHLVFYAINPQPPFNIAVNTNNQFGLEPNLPLQEADLLGVPTLKLAVVIRAVSRKIHGGVATFDVDLPLTGTPGIECRSGGGTNDFTMVVTFSGPVMVMGSPQAQVTMGVGTVGTGGLPNGGMVAVSGAEATIPLTNVDNAQTIQVTLNGVNGSGPLVISMSILAGDTTANGATNASDVSQTKSKSGQAVSAANFRTDVTLTNSINASDVSFVKSKSGTALPP
jgi:hypothetical protein